MSRIGYFDRGWHLPHPEIDYKSLMPPRLQQRLQSPQYLATTSTGYILADSLLKLSFQNLYQFKL